MAALTCGGGGRPIVGPAVAPTLSLALVARESFKVNQPASNNETETTATSQASVKAIQ